jgi:hypothetical protein
LAHGARYSSPARDVRAEEPMNGPATPAKPQSLPWLTGDVGEGSMLTGD